MKLLLDTCTFLWIIGSPSKLSERALDLFVDPENPAYLSVVSGWEIALKHGLGRLPLPTPPERFVPMMRELHAIESLPLDEGAPLLVASLPDHHKDPFDRMLICQAKRHDLVLLTPDQAIRQYPVETAW